MKKTWLLVSVLLLSTLSPLFAQLHGDDIVGFAGLQSGTQSEPCLAISVPVYFYNASKLKNGDGNVINSDPGIHTFLTGAVVSYVSKLKILNANLGASILVPFVTNRIEYSSTSMKGSFAFSDLFIQPVQLGWHTKRFDFIFAYGLYLPTGKYTAGGSDNSGLGMWANEFSAGSTVYFDAKKSISFSALFAYELNSKKKNSDIKAGDILTIHGGLGKTFMKPVKGTPIPMIFNAGIVYYFQTKVTDDVIPLDAPISLQLAKDRVFGAGLEGSVFFPKITSMLDFRWFYEMGAVNRFQGNTYLLTITKVINPKKK